MKDDKFLLILLAVLAFVGFLILRPFLTYVLFSVVLTVVAYPLYEKVKARMKFEALSAIIIIIMIIVVIIVPSVLLIITIFSQANDFITNIGAADFSNLQKAENALENYLGTEIKFAEPLRVWILSLSSTVRSFILSNIIAFTRTIVDFLAGVVLMFFIMFYLFIDGKRLIQQVKNNFPIEEKYKDYLLTRTYRTIQGLFLGLFLTAILQGVLACIGYFIFGVPNAILLGFLTVIVSLIPFLGPVAVYVPAGLFLILKGNLLSGLGLMIYGFALISTIDNFIRPSIVRSRSEVHPLYVILGVLGGVSLVGFSGIVVGPLILTLLQEVIETYRLAKKKD